MRASLCAEADIATCTFQYGSFGLCAPAIGIIMETSMRGFYWTRIAVHNTDAADKYLSETSWHNIRSLMIGYTLSATLSAGFCVALPGLSFWAMVITVCLIFVIGIPMVIVLRKLFWKGEQ